MALSREFIGRAYPPNAVYAVGRAALRAFASSIGDDTPACHDVESARALGHPDLVAPPTFPIVLVWRADDRVARDPALGLDYGRVVHREQRFVHHRPIHAGDELLVHVTVKDIKSVAGSELLVTQQEITTVVGAPVCDATTTLVCRGGT
jgi:acyl dehydratase